MTAKPNHRVKSVGLFSLPSYIWEALLRYGVAIAWAWMYDAIRRDWRDGTLLTGFIAYDDDSNEVGRGWTVRRACRAAGWSECP
jgi:hypothetical protein